MDPRKLSNTLEKSSMNTKLNNDPSFDFIVQTVATEVRDIFNPELSKALQGMDSLINRIDDFLDTLNPQDPIKVSVESVRDRLVEAQKLVEKEINELQMSV